MDTFLSRIKNTVGSVGRDGASGRKSTAGSKPSSRSIGKAIGRSKSKPSGSSSRTLGGGAKGKAGKAGKAGPAGGQRGPGWAASLFTAKAGLREKAGSGPAAKSGSETKGRFRTTSAAKSRTAKKTDPRGSSRGTVAKNQAVDEKQDSGSKATEARRGPSMVVRVFAMLLAFAAMVAFAGVLSRLTLEPSAASVSIAHTNLEPGSSIRAYLSQPAFQDTVKQLGGNIALGVPFGVLLPVLIPRARGFVRVTAATAVVMLLVELVQGALINGRAFDIDDVILNSTGALLGYLLLGRLLGRVVHPPRRRWWQRWIDGPVAN